MTLVRPFVRLGRAIAAFDRRQRRRFFDGPAVYDYPGRRMTGYKSPNVMLAQWLQAFAASHLTMAGRLLLVLTAVIFLAGMTTLLMPLYLLSFVLVALFVTDFAVGWVLRPRLEMRRLIPVSSPANAEVVVEYELANRRAVPAYDVYVETIPLPPPITFVGGLACVPRLAPGERLRLTNRLRVNRRGCYHLPAPVADSAFPFGLWRWGSRGPATGALLIYPDFAPLASVRLPVGAYQAHGESAMAALSGESLEFLGCREYRYGDNPRHLHAQSWARLGQPVVKEFRDEHLSRLALVVDTWLPPRPLWRRLRHRREPAFEANLALAAAVCEYLQRHQYLVELFVPGEDGCHIAGGRGREQLRELLELFAGLEPRRDTTFAGLDRDDFAELRQASGALVLLLDWDAPRQRFVEELTAAGVGARVFLVAEALRTLPLHPLNPTQLSPDDIFGGRLTEL